MKEKLLAVWAKVSPVLSSIYSKSPLLVGIAIGYFGKPIIAGAVKLVAWLIKTLIG